MGASTIDKHRFLSGTVRVIYAGIVLACVAVGALLASLLWVVYVAN